MKKKITLVLATVTAAVLLGGCTSGGVSISSEAAQADPWETFESLEAAEEAVGFEIAAPDMAQYGENEVYRVCAALAEIEIQYNDGEEASGTYVRKADDDGDISGDYEEYAYETEADGITFKGNSEDEIVLAVWHADDYAYCVRIADGVAADTMSALAAEVK